MSNSLSLRKILLSLFLSIIFSGFIFCSGSKADITESIVNDFSPLSGVVVMVRNGEFIIDLDATAGLAKGDLLSVISPGETVVHPKTGKVLGHLDQVKGILKVILVKDGFSFTRGLQINDVRIGDAVRRFENIKAIFWDYTGEGKPLFLRLQDALSHMKWVDYENSQNLKPQDPRMIPETQGGVVFILKGNTLQVRDPEFLIIREYHFSKPIEQHELFSYGKDEKMVITPTEPKISERQEDRIYDSLTESGLEEKSITVSTSPSPDSTIVQAPVVNVTPKQELSEGVKPVFQNSQLIDKLPGGPVIMADFMPYENGLLLATTDGRQIRVFDVSGKISLLSEIESPLYDPILSLSWWKPRQSELTFLAVVNWSDHRPSSTLFSYKNNRLHLVKSRIPRFIAAFDTDNDRIPETLLGQDYDPREFFGYHIQEIQLKGNDIEYKKPSLKLPKRFTVLGGLLSDLTGNGVTEVAFIRNEILYIYSGNEPLYKSPKKMGGSLSTLLYETNPTEKHIITNSVSIEIPPVAVDLDGDGLKEIVAVASDRNFLSKTGIAPGIEGTWLTVLKYNNKIFDEGTMGEKINTPIQGMTFFDNKLFLVVSETGSVFSKGGQSRLILLPVIR